VLSQRCGLSNDQTGSLHLTLRAMKMKPPPDILFHNWPPHRQNRVAPRPSQPIQNSPSPMNSPAVQRRYFRHFLNRIIEKARDLRFPVSLLLSNRQFQKIQRPLRPRRRRRHSSPNRALMKRCVRDHDLVARISGDEFAVVFWEKEAPANRATPRRRPGRPPQTPNKSWKASANSSPPNPSPA